jgi:GntR family transcriptional regulator
MFFTINTTDSLPIYAQLVRQIKYAIASQALRPGQLLPSVRQLSVELAINPNTVARAYQQLQQEDILESLRGRGLSVRAGATAACHQMRRELISRRLHTVLSEALQSGLTETEITHLVERHLQSLSSSTPAVDDVDREVQ